MARIIKRYTLTLRILDDHADNVDESVLLPILNSGLEDEDVDAIIEIDPENSPD